MEKKKGEIEMNYNILDLPQRSPEWQQIRSECFTGTTAEHLLKLGKTEGLKKVKQMFEYSLAHPGTGWAAQRGLDLEPVARNLLNQKMQKTAGLEDVHFEEVGFVKRTDMEHVGCSPDGCYIKDGKIIANCEIKCFTEKHHLACSGKPDLKIETQIQWCLWVTGAEYCMFCQYNPDMLDPKKTSDGKRHLDKVLFITKILPDPDYFEAFEKALC